MTLAERLSLEHPIVQAGMGGGLATGALAGEVSAAGGLGTVGMLAADRLQHELLVARERAGAAPVAANLLVPFARREHVDACRGGGARAVVLHAGLKPALVEGLKADRALVLATVGTVEQARRALAAGADGVVVQGIEAGGHLVGVEPALDALEAVLEVAGAAPVLVAGAIAEHDDVRRALATGAAAVVAGTRFLLTDECRAHPAYKRRVLAAQRTIETQLFGLGWPMRHRVVPNAATERWCHEKERGPAAIVKLQAASAPLRRLPQWASDAMARLQRPWLPVFGPAAPLWGMPERMVDAAALYAGDTALRINEIVPAAEAVGQLAAPR